jgi:release factor glutamine methyltransferase
VLFSIDVSQIACITTEKTLQKNVPNKFNGIVQTDLLAGIRIYKNVDVLVFNPPYVPTDKQDEWAGPLGLSWKGGDEGMNTTWRLINDLPVFSLKQR